MLMLWKFFKVSTVRVAVFENAQEADNLSILKILKACITRWLTHGKTANRIILRFCQIIAAHDTLYSVRRDDGAMGIKDKLLNPSTILMLLLLAEALAPINVFCCYLQTRHLNYITALDKFRNCIRSLKDLKTKVQNFDVNNETDGLKFFNKAKELLQLSQHGTAGNRNLRNSQFADNITSTVNVFITDTAVPFMTDLIREVEIALEGASPVLPAFDLFNPMAHDQSQAHRLNQLSVLLDHYGNAKSDEFLGQTTTSPALVSSLEAQSEALGFFCTFDDTICRETLALQSRPRQAHSEISDIPRFLEENKLSPADIYHFMALRGEFNEFPNMELGYLYPLLLQT